MDLTIIKQTVLVLDSTVLLSYLHWEGLGLRLTAYFDGNVKIPSSEQATKEIAYANASSKRRYPANGVTGNYFHLDLVGYTDKPMANVGLKSYKQKGWLGNFMDPCITSDYRDMKLYYFKCICSDENSKYNHVGAQDR
ncbi:hypothetical protein ACMFMG_005806 [Clarireedia jacksonii]